MHLTLPLVCKGARTLGAPPPTPAWPPPYPRPTPAYHCALVAPVPSPPARAYWPALAPPTHSPSAQPSVADCERRRRPEPRGLCGACALGGGQPAASTGPGARPGAPPVPACEGHRSGRRRHRFPPLPNGTRGRGKSRARIYPCTHSTKCDTSRPHPTTYLSTPGTTTNYHTRHAPCACPRSPPRSSRRSISSPASSAGSDSLPSPPTSRHSTRTASCCTSRASAASTR